MKQTQNLFTILIASFVVTGLLLVSYINGGLFLEQLLIGFSIIGLLVFIKLQSNQSAQTQSRQEQNHSEKRAA